jgi:hypothetical protein
VAAAAGLLDVYPGTIWLWLRRGVLTGRQLGKGTPWHIVLPEREITRLRARLAHPTNQAFEETGTMTGSVTPPRLARYLIDFCITRRSSASRAGVGEFMIASGDVRSHPRRIRRMELNELAADLLPPHA